MALLLPDLLARVPHGALRNAREALADVRAAVADRRRLTDDLDADPVPGRLVRLEEAEAWRLLGGSRLARLAFPTRAGALDVVPVTCAVVGRTVLVRSGPGPKLQAAERRERVVLEADEVDLETRSGWSVVASGRARRLAPLEVAALGDRLPEPWADGPRTAVIAVEVERITARRLH